MRAALARLVHPALLRLDPETAHRLTILGLRWMPRAVAPVDPPELAVEVFGRRFPNPIGLAAGFDKNAEVPDAMLGLGFGFVEVGSLTPLPQPGNPRPRVFRLPRDAALVNRYGFNNRGHAEAHARLARRARSGGLVGVNIGTNKDAVDRAADYAAGVAGFADVADYLAVNVSSPNTPGLRALQAGAALDALLARVVEAREAVARTGRRVPVLLKIAPDLGMAELDDVVAVARRRGLDGMIVSNTTVARPKLHHAAEARESGGLSGRPLFDPSTRMLAETFLRVERQFPLIGVGGVEDGATALRKVRAGATLVQLYTALVFQGPGLVARIKRELVAALGSASLAEQVGRDAAERAVAASG